MRFVMIVENGTEQRTVFHLVVYSSDAAANGLSGAAAVVNVSDRACVSIKLVVRLQREFSLSHVCNGQGDPRNCAAMLRTLSVHDDVTRFAILNAARARSQP